MDQYERVKNLVGRITYKPGWKMVVSRTRTQNEYPSRYDLPAVWITVTLPAIDVNDPEHKIILSNQKCFWQYTLETMKDEQILEYCVVNLLLDTEKHELDEWFKFDGIQIFDPHKQGATQ
jgi:hypothetical protein